MRRAAAPAAEGGSGQHETVLRLQPEEPMGSTAAWLLGLRGAEDVGGSHTEGHQVGHGVGVARDAAAVTCGAHHLPRDQVVRPDIGRYTSSPCDE